MITPEDTIVAPATASGSAALAVLRLSGPDAVGIVAKAVREGDCFLSCKPAVVRRYVLASEEGGLADEVTAVKYLAPRSFTGEDTVEIICHGSAILVAALMARLCAMGARVAGRGEFTRRAFLNGKMDLAHAEAINQLIGSRTLAQARGASVCYLGGYDPSIVRWGGEIVGILSDLETQIEFGEEDGVSGALWERIHRGIAAVVSDAEAQLQRYQKVRLADRGLEVALVGPANAGKSTVLNRILGYERVLVHSERGTTRDSVSERATMGGVEVSLVDTAGLGETIDVVEMMGIERTLDYVRRAEILVWVTAADEEFTEQEDRLGSLRGSMDGVFGIVNKSDLADASRKADAMEHLGVPAMIVCAKDDGSAQRLVSFVGGAVSKVAATGTEPSFLCTARQEAVISRMVESLREMSCLGVGHEEIAAEHCRTALGCLDEFLGKRTTDEIVEKVFAEFCIGK